MKFLKISSLRNWPNSSRSPQRNYTQRGKFKALDLVILDTIDLVPRWSVQCSQLIGLFYLGDIGNLGQQLIVERHHRAFDILRKMRCYCVMGDIRIHGDLDYKQIFCRVRNSELSE